MFASGFIGEAKDVGGGELLGRPGDARVEEVAGGKNLQVGFNDYVDF